MYRTLSKVVTLFTDARTDTERSAKGNRTVRTDREGAEGRSERSPVRIRGCVILKRGQLFSHVQRTEARHHLRKIFLRTTICEDTLPLSEHKFVNRLSWHAQVLLTLESNSLKSSSYHNCEEVLKIVMVRKFRFPESKTKKKLLSSCRPLETDVSGSHLHFLCRTPDLIPPYQGSAMCCACNAHTKGEAVLRRAVTRAPWLQGSKAGPRLSNFQQDTLC